MNFIIGGTAVITITVIGYAVYLWRRGFYLRKKLLGFQRNVAREREAAADIVALARNVIAAGNENLFLPQFVRYVLRALNADGAAILQSGDGSSLCGLAIAGSFPPLQAVAPPLREQLLAHDGRHTEFFRQFRAPFSAADLVALCGDRGYAFFDHTCPSWCPEDFTADATRILLAPIRPGNRIAGGIIVTSRNDFEARQLTEADGELLARLAEIAAMTLELLNRFHERR
ncbi:MAG: hypothetical protein PHQ27_09020, partial [Victivallales bacterium]|nr:hypothetical protein [Victivallales bacterium]